MTTPDKDHDRLHPDAGDSTGGGGLLTGLGAGALLILCCAAPVLIAGGVLGVLGAWLISPWVIGAAVALAIAGGIAWTRRRRRRSDCC